MENELKTTYDKKGWLIPYLLGLDDMFYKRWIYWTRICMSNKVPDEPIPVIRFKPTYEYKEKLVSKNLRKCLDHARCSSNALHNFADWILWGFGRGNNLFPSIDEGIDDYWYRTFNLGLFYKEPADHFSELASDYMGRTNKLGFFATPSHVVEMMTLMTFGGKPEHKHKTMSVCDPCLGTGNMLLHASNYSMNLYGNDISLLLTKLATINAFIYMPWVVAKPKNLTIFDAIINVELPSGIKIPLCNKCGNEESFLLELETEHELSVLDSGLISIDKPALSKDLIAKKLKPENISCAKCVKEVV